VRCKREGVEEVFASHCVSHIMQQAVVHRYLSQPRTSHNLGDNGGGVLTSSMDDASCTAVSPSTLTSTCGGMELQRLRIPAHYTLRPCSRTRRALLPAQAPSPLSQRVDTSCFSCAATAATPHPSVTGAGHDDTWWCEEEMCVAHAVAAECLRHRSFNRLTQVDLRRLCGLRDAAEEWSGGGGLVDTITTTSTATTTTPLVSWQEFFELPPRWVMQSLGTVDRHVFEGAAEWKARRIVTPLDVGATVVLRDDPALAAPSGSTTMGEVPHLSGASPAAVLYRVVATAAMARGAYWVDITPVDLSATCPQRVRRVDRDALRLSPPVPLHVDALVPCDELYSDRGISTSIYVFFLRALQKQHQQRRHSSNRAKKAVGRTSRLPSSVSTGSCSDDDEDPSALAADLSLRLARCAQQRRAELAEQLQRCWLSIAEGSAAAVDEISAGEEPRPAVPAPVLLQVRVDVARDCLQLRARAVMNGGAPCVASCHATPAAAYAVNAVAKGKRPRDTETSDGDTCDNCPSIDRGGPSALRERRQAEQQDEVESPVVEVLLRCVRKLAALYDMTRTASLAPRHDLSSDTHDGPERHRECNTAVGTAVSSRSTDDKQPPFSCSAAREVLECLIHDGSRRDDAASEALPALPSPPWFNVTFGDADTPSCGLLRSSQGTAALPSAGKAFLGRLFTLLLRYRSLFGEQGYNQGPQAAVPPPVMEQLARSFDIRAEAFGSPLNVQLPQFGSVFPDTDVYFGAMGSFFDVLFGVDASPSSSTSPCSVEPAQPNSSGGGEGEEKTFSSSSLTCSAGCHVEVNPPFDTALLRHMEEHLVACLKRVTASAQSVLFLIVLPSHDLDDGEKGGGGAAAAAAETAGVRGGGRTSAAPVSTDRSLRESPYCLSHTLCNASEAVYVDGHQHLLESPFFCIGTPTRLILLGNEAARARFPSAAAQLEQARLSWKRLTEGAMKRKTVHDKA
jgi:phosphorylated CTD-interacting factor 1